MISSRTPRPGRIGVYQQSTHRKLALPQRIKFSSPTVELTPELTLRASQSIDPHLEYQSPAKNSLFRLTQKFSKVLLGLGLASSPFYLVPICFGNFKASGLIFTLSCVLLLFGMLLGSLKKDQI